MHKIRASIIICNNLITTSLRLLTKKTVVYNYFDKRDKNGLLLRYSAEKLATSISEEYYNDLRKYPVLNTLRSLLPETYIESYFIKTIRENIISECHKLVLNNWNIINNPFPSSSVVINKDKYFEILLNKSLIYYLKNRLKYSKRNLQ